MFNLQHILYMIISGILTAVLLVLFSRYAKDDHTKNRILRFFAIITVMIHYSDLWVDYFTNGGIAEIQSTHILPVYPCNVVMWMLLVASLLKDKDRLLFQLLGEFCFYGGTLCSVLGIALNFNFDNNPTLADYDVLKGLLSHSTMLVGCLYMLVGRYIKISMFNPVSVAAGLGVFVSCGTAVNALYTSFGMEPPDGMWLLSNPYISMPPMLLGLFLVIALFFVLALWELRLPVEERWYHKLHRRDKHERTVF